MERKPTKTREERNAEKITSSVVLYSCPAAAFPLQYLDLLHMFSVVKLHVNMMFTAADLNNLTKLPTKQLLMKANSLMKPSRYLLQIHENTRGSTPNCK